MISERDIRLSRNKRRAGFSLTEFAIVLGIMGIVLGALWGVVALVHENIKRHQTAEQMVLTINNIRGFYSSRTRIATPGGATDYDSVTQYLLGQNVFPTEMLRDRTAATLVADHPWGSEAADGSSLDDGGVRVGAPAPMNAAEFFSVQFLGLKYSSCVALADRLTGSDMPLGLEEVVINGTSHTAFPVSPDAATAECDDAPSGTENIMEFTFQLRDQISK